ncbi:transporter [Paraflavitalea sp. CAU 1676]|uniref:SphA family protein n=1 Tax=Paraflavitalea sp. CAU 1676 TaxID=3032598 RepID=UPI0023DB5D3B|nr:transporter [Paraflavitalea sp. CAU 1676]MDF2191590.1 transporter [Paraflavitalea sp. CAU 1676]
MKHTTRKAAALWIILLTGTSILQQATAQLKGYNILGDQGLQAGTQPPPSISLAIPLYVYSASSYRNSSGDKLSSSPSLDMFFTGIAGSIVTNVKVFNGNWGATIIVPFASNRVEGNVVNVDGPFSFTDMYIQPIQLGWHTKRADFNMGYGIFIPTGKYEFGGDDNTGLGMWAQELTAGTTLFLNKTKTFHFATTFSYEVHGDKKDTDIKTGDILSIEGGLGHTWYKKGKTPIPTIFNAGLIYYMQFKISDDKIPVGNTVFSGSKDRVYGWGVEGNVFMPGIRSQLGLRWLAETGARNRFEGSTFFITLGYMLKSLSKK